MTDGELGAAGESGIGAVFQMIVELFTCMDGELSCFEAGSAFLDLPCAISMTQVIPDPSLPSHRGTTVVRWRAGTAHEGICTG